MKQISKVELRKLYNEMSSADLIKHLDISRGALYALLRRAGVGLKTGNRKPKQTIKLID
jgi:hypothetical protein